MVNVKLHSTSLLVVKYWKIYFLWKPFHATGLSLYPLKTLKNRFFDALREYKWYKTKMLNTWSLRNYEQFWKLKKHPKMVIEKRVEKAPTFHRSNLEVKNWLIATILYHLYLHYNPNNLNVFPKVTGNIWKPPNLENSGKIFPKHILIDWKWQTSNLKRLLCYSKFSKTNFQQFQKQQNVKKLLLFRLHYRGWNCKM